MSSCRTHRARGGAIRPLHHAEEALAVVDAVASRPELAETICLVVDEGYLPLTCLVVEGGGHPDAVLEVGELLGTAVRTGDGARVVVVSVRPHHPVGPDDVMRWHELDARLAGAGVELMEWFVTHHGQTVALTPLAGEPSRWPRP